MEILNDITPELRTLNTDPLQKSGIALLFQSIFLENFMFYLVTQVATVGY
jgi:hypothetical protein